MTNDPTSRPRAVPLSAGSAFVVHLTVPANDPPEAVQGRIEHVLTGRAMHFTSPGELIGFMRQTLREENRGAGEGSTPERGGSK